MNEVDVQFAVGLPAGSSIQRCVVERRSTHFAPVKGWFFTHVMHVLLFAIVGTIFASFANVVASRGPRKWQLVPSDDKPTGLAYPPSQCETCGHPLATRDLIPIVSYLILRGRCRHCGSRFSPRHLVVELLGATLGLLIALRFGLSAEAGFGALLAFGLLTLAVIDAETGFLPDAITWPLVGAGLVVSIAPGGVSFFGSALGAALGGGGLWLISTGYKALRGRDGLGGGDVKLVAAGGAWCGAYALPFILLAASLAGLLFAAAMMLAGRKETALSAELRFGPFLSTAIAVVFFVGPPLMLV